MPTLSPLLGYLGCHVGRGLRHSSPSSNIEICAGVSVTEPSFVTGHVKRRAAAVEISPKPLDPEIFIIFDLSAAVRTNAMHVS